MKEGITTSNTEKKFFFQKTVLQPPFFLGEEKRREDAKFKAHLNDTKPDPETSERSPFYAKIIKN